MRKKSRIQNLAVQPNHEKILLSSFEYNLLKKHVEHFDQQMSMGAGHSLLGNKDVKIMKNCTIILIGCMTLALKVLAMFTLSLGILILKSAVLINNFTCQIITIEKHKNIKGYHCGIQVRGPHLTLGDPPFYS